MRNSREQEKRREMLMSLPKSVAKIVKKFSEVERQLRPRLIERHDSLHGVLLSLVAEQHALLIGPPGCAKSMLTEEVCDRIKGISYFERLLTKHSTPEELFGPPSLKLLKMDRFERVLTGMMPSAHVARIDEIWKGNSSILNSLLSLINERVFYNGTAGVFSSPLISIFGTSNEMPEDDSLSALYDRFMLRYIVDYVGEDSSFKQVLTFNGTAPRKGRALITLDDLVTLHEFRAGSVNIGDDIIDMIAQMRTELRREGIVVSDRRWRTSLDVIKSETLLCGRNDVRQDDLNIMADVLWNKPDERKTVAGVILQISNPSLKRALELKDAAADVYSQALLASEDEKDGYGIEANKKLKKFHEELEKLSKTNKSGKVGKVRDQIKRQQNEVLKHCLGLEIDSLDDSDEVDDEVEFVDVEDELEEV